MRFVVRKGTDPVARRHHNPQGSRLPFGGVLKVGPTHFLVQGGDPSESTALELGPITLANAQTSEGQSIEAGRAVLGPAEVVVIDVEKLEVDPKFLVRGLQGRPMSNGDRVEVAADSCPPRTLLLHDQTGRTRRRRPYRSRHSIRVEDRRGDVKAQASSHR